jgi:formylglycine-generating enzyme required for sulfatase activity
MKNRFTHIYLLVFILLIVNKSLFAQSIDLLPPVIGEGVDWNNAHFTALQASLKNDGINIERAAEDKIFLTIKTRGTKYIISISSLIMNNERTDIIVCNASDEGLKKSILEGQMTTGILSLYNLINQYGSLEIPMVDVSGGVFNASMDLNHELRVSDFSIGKTELTWKQWSTVYAWAVENGYVFQNPGRMGSKWNGIDMTGEHPVTSVSWRDAIVWCNAATEFINSFNNSKLKTVYNWNGEAIRNSDDDAFKFMIPDSEANGFRLPEGYEWEYAARYRDGSDWTPSDYASGASANYSDSYETKKVAWFEKNSSRTHPVGDKQANALDLYDMSGNVKEYCFDIYKNHKDENTRMVRGGSWESDIKYLKINYISLIDNSYERSYIGFRVAYSTHEYKTSDYMSGLTKETKIAGIPMIEVPEGKDTNRFLMGKTELTWMQWSTVYSWAVENGYVFQNTGRMGSADSGKEMTEEHPVTGVSWWDVIVWCNAATEYFNALTGSTLKTVYNWNGDPIRDSSDSSVDVFDSMIPDPEGNGIRLPEIVEWKYAAGYLDGVNRTPWNYASGASADYEDIDAINDVAWYETNSSKRTHPVGEKQANALGLYDMSGNVHEYCLDTYILDEINHCKVYGGSWTDSADDVNYYQNFYQERKSTYKSTGFRIVYIP